MTRPVWALALALVAPACLPPRAGVCDGVIDDGEDCDDGNDDADDGCDCTAHRLWPTPLDTSGVDPRAPVLIADDGAWCWFQDERAMFVGDRLFVASLSHRGDAQVSSYDLVTGARQHAVVHGQLERDDHDVASLVAVADGSVLAFYGKHDGSQEMSWRRSRPDGDLSSWSAEQHLTMPDDACYANTVQLAAEGDGDDPRLYLFFRGLHYNPTFDVSDDGGETWSPPAQILDSHEYTALGRVDHRPYVKYVSDGADTVHLLYTEGHPDEFSDNSLYHLFYRDGALHRSDGTRVGGMRVAEQPRLAPTAGTRIYDGVADPGGEAWTWDAALDADGHPVVVFATYPDGRHPGADHRYRYARWDGDAWHDYPVAHAGTQLCRGEPFYSGGIALDPDDPDIVYFSSNVDPRTGEPGTSGHFELYRGVTADGGASWEITALTADSVVDNLRPIVPAMHPGGVAVLWLEGVYNSYLDWNTRVVGRFGGLDAPPIDRGEPAVALARFDLEAVSGNRMTARRAGVTLEITGITGSRGDGRGDDLVYGDHGGYLPTGKLRVTLSDLEPGRDYVVRLHAHDPVIDYLTMTLWFRADAADLYVDGSDSFVGAHRLSNGADAGEGRLDLALAADRDGRIDLVARGLSFTGGDQVAVLNRVEVVERPASTAVARFDLDVAPGDGTATGFTSLALDDRGYRGIASAGGITATVWSDRADAVRRRDDDTSEVAADLIFGDDELVVDVAGLEVGRTYEVTIHATDVGSNLYDASHWWLEEPGRQPVTVRGLQLNNRSTGPAAWFRFLHVAHAPVLRLRGQDVLYGLSTAHSVVVLNALELRVVP